MDHLFVYGTLLSGARDEAGATMRARLGRESAFVGRATMPGSLYDLGDYPGMTAAGESERSAVRGEVVRFHAPETSLRWLDKYEDVDAIDPQSGLYRRVQRPSLLDDWRVLPCWVYIVNAMAPGTPLITGGDWLQHCAGRC